MSDLKRFLCLLFVSIVVCAMFAQNTTGINELLERRAVYKVNKLKDNLSFIADKSKDRKVREFYRQQALNLFLGGGEPYFDIEKEDSINKGVKMETTSVYRKKPTKRLMKDYFTGLIDLRYYKVDIETTKIYIDDLQKIDDDKFVCTACFEYLLIYYNDNGMIFIRRTDNRINVHMQRDETIDGEEFIVLLGDVTAVELPSPI